MDLFSIQNDLLSIGQVLRIRDTVDREKKLFTDSTEKKQPFKEPVEARWICVNP